MKFIDTTPFSTKKFYCLLPIAYCLINIQDFRSHVLISHFLHTFLIFFQLCFVFKAVFPTGFVVDDHHMVGFEDDAVGTPLLAIFRDNGDLVQYLVAFTEIEIRSQMGILLRAFEQLVQPCADLLR